MLSLTPATASHIALTAVLVVTACAQAGELRVREAAFIDDSVVRLSDVVEFHGVDALRAESLGNVILGPAPLRQSYVTTDVIRERLSSLSIGYGDLTFSGTSRCSVTRRVARPVSQPFVAKPSLKEHRDAVQRLEVEVLRLVEAAFPDQGPFQVKVDAGQEAVRVVRDATEPLRFAGGSSDITQPQRMQIVGHNAPFTAFIKRVPYVAVAAVPLDRGVIVQAAHIRLEPRDEVGVDDPRLLVGQEIARPIPEGRTFRASDVRKIKLVRANEIVTVSVSIPGLAVHRMMKAKADGGLGDTIACVGLSSKTTIQAVVTGPNTAEIAFDANAGGGALDAGVDQSGVNQSIVQPVAARRTGSGTPLSAWGANR